MKMICVSPWYFRDAILVRDQEATLLFSSYFSSILPLWVEGLRVLKPLGRQNKRRSSSLFSVSRAEKPRKRRSPRAERPQDFHLPARFSRPPYVCLSYRDGITNLQHQHQSSTSYNLIFVHQQRLCRKSTGAASGEPKCLVADRDPSYEQTSCRSRPVVILWPPAWTCLAVSAKSNWYQGVNMLVGE